VRLRSHIVHGIEALPLVNSFARSDDADERAVFARVYLDLVADGLRRDAAPPQDWREALQACLSHAGEAERDAYLAALAQVAGAVGAEDGDVDALIGAGLLEEAVALAADAKAPLAAERYASLVPRARALARIGDRRLADTLLKRRPLPLAAAPLFLEADPAQRAALLLAAQRSDLGRRPLGVTLKLREDVAARLEYAAIAGDVGEFAAALGAALGCETELARALAEDASGEPLALGLIALGAARDVAVRVVTALDLREGAAFSRIHTLARLFDHVSASTARRLVAAFLSPIAPRAAARATTGAAGRAAPTPSPFLRREAPARRSALSPETSARSAQGSRSP
jgi:hypothetical protein